MMNMQEVLEVLKVVGYLALGGLVIYFKCSESAQKKSKQVQEVLAEISANANKLIAEAEAKYHDATNMGGIKFNEVVDQLHNLVPDILQDIITKEMIGGIVQKAFDEIEEYVALQLDKAINKTGE